MNMLDDLPAGEEPPQRINAVIEVESGTRDKYEYDGEHGVFVLDRILYSSVMFPFDYGFVPRTWQDDGDPLDVMVLGFEPLSIGCVIRVRPVAVLVMDDEKGEDAKVLAVIEKDPRFADVRDVTDIQPHTLKEIQEFFETYKRLEPGKWAKFERWGNAEEARGIVTRAMELYKTRKGKEK